MRQARWLCGLILLQAMGCVATEIGVRNPVPGLTTVAVAPFFNLSAEPTVDGRRFATAYFSELQKTPGFQVLPVGMAERAITQHNLQMSDPADALRLADILGVDAVVVGAVTDYDPYYPPRIGLQVSWYTPNSYTFSPGIPVDPAEGNRRLKARHHQTKKHDAEACPPQQETAAPVVRSQSPPGYGPVPPPGGLDAGLPPSPDTPELPFQQELPLQQDLPISLATESIEPLMSYTRMFDGADARLTARLRDYVELSGDLRSGGWEGYLHRSEDFIRFTAHLMVVEMLQLHGGEIGRRFVWMSRKHH